MAEQTPAKRRQRNEESFLRALSDYGIDRAPRWLQPPRGGLTQAELGDRTRLSRQLISTLCDEFSEALAGSSAPPAEPQSGRIGSRPTEWKLDPGVGGVIATVSVGDLEPDSKRPALIGLADLNVQLFDEPLHRRVADSPREAWAEISRALADLLADLQGRAEMPQGPARIIATAVSMPAPVRPADPDRPEEEAELRGGDLGGQWTEPGVFADLITELRRAGLPPDNLLVGRALAHCAIAEYRWGAARGKELALVVQLDSRLRASILHGGVVWSGVGGIAGELIVPSELPVKPGPKLVEAIAPLLGPVIVALNPDAVLLGGELGRQLLPACEEELRAALARRAGSLALEQCELRAAGAPEHAALRGGAVAALKPVLAPYLRARVLELRRSLHPYQGADVRADTQPGSGSARTLGAEGWAAFNAADYGLARERFSEALERARQLHELGVTAWSHHGLGTLYLRESDYPEAKRAFEAELEAAGDLRGIEAIGARAWGQRGLALLANAEADYQRALTHIALGLEVAKDNPERAWLAASALLATRGEAQRSLGLPDEALASYQLAVEQLAHPGRELPKLAWRYHQLAEALLATGRPAQAKTELIRGLEVAVKFEDVRAIAVIAAMLACLARGDAIREPDQAAVRSAMELLGRDPGPGDRDPLEELGLAIEKVEAMPGMDAGAVAGLRDILRKDDPADTLVKFGERLGLTDRTGGEQDERHPD